MLVTKKIFFPAFILFATVIIFLNSSCGPYSLVDASVPADIKSIRINFIENKAQYVNPQLSPNLTDRIRQKISNQTRLTLTNSDNADYDISGYISNYTISTSGINNQQVATNRITVGVHLVWNNNVKDTLQEFDISRSFEFAATRSQQSAEAELLDEMARNLSDDIFNRVFSNW